MLLCRLHVRLPAFSLVGRIGTAHSRGLASSTKETVKPYYITTPIFYPNAVPHIGHLYSLVTADIFARFQRLLNPTRPVHFLAGTDEHGLKIQKAAQDKGLTPEVFCDNISQRFRDLAAKAQISHTRFIRTTEKVHHDAVQHVWRQLDAKGLIYKGNYSGWYSVSDECFYTDSQITRIPNPNPNPTTAAPEITISTETGSSVEWHSEQNYMFRLSSFRESLLRHYKSNPGIIFPEQHHAHIVDILERAPLEDLSVSRPRSRLSWGVSVPNDPEHTIYVWFDALLVYLAGVGYPWAASGGLAEGWPANLQVIGKDILRFHAIYFPAMLQALELPLPHRLLSHAHWTVDQKKMSKSVGNVADPFEAIEEVSIDVVRYYLARVGGRFRDDVDWSPEQLNKYNEEIQSYIGNFLMRITSRRITSLSASAPHPKTLSEIFQTKNPDRERMKPNQEVIAAQIGLAENVKSCLEHMEVGEGLQHIVDLLKLANKAVTTVCPWNGPAEISQASYITSLETLRISGICLQPFVPGTAGKLLDALGVPLDERAWDFAVIKEDGNGGLDMRGGVSQGSVERGVRLFDVGTKGDHRQTRK